MEEILLKLKKPFLWIDSMLKIVRWLQKVYAHIMELNKIPGS